VQVDSILTYKVENLDMQIGELAAKAGVNIQWVRRQRFFDCAE
jgi:hypothetical protein